MLRVAGILLAAGQGARFGGHKLRVPLADGTPLAMAAARSLRAALDDEVLVVVRPEDRLLAERFAEDGFHTVVNERAAHGMGTSLACGVRAAAGADGWLIALADMPAIRAATIRQVAVAVAQGAALAAPFHAGRRGHPVGFGSSLRDELLALDGDRGANGLLSRYSTRLMRIEVDDPGILFDVDTPADLAARFERGAGLTS